MTDGQNYPDFVTKKKFWQHDTQNDPSTSLTPCLIILVAMGACPCPRERE